MTDTNAKTIEYPTADELDTGECLRRDWRVDLYLIPADESDSGLPTIIEHAGVGNIGTPMRAWHNRWTHVISYGADVVGASVLRWLESEEFALVALSGYYLGSEWDGSNYRGRWSEDAHDIEYRISASDPSFDHYWDAGDWFGPACHRWPELCSDAGVDLERALGSDWESVAREVAEIVEPMQDEPVSRTEEYAIDCARDWRDEHGDSPE